MKNKNHVPDKNNSIAEALDILDAAEVRRFLELHPDWKPRCGDSATLWTRAQEIAGSAHPFLMDLEQALFELRKQDPQFGRYLPKPEPAEPVHLTDKGIIEVPSNTGATLVVDPAVRRELQAVPLKELARRAHKDIYARQSETRRIQRIAGEL